ncbi:MAG: T9SS type A sorting domain-containing protein, partial [Muribaculaceae bacterium]
GNTMFATDTDTPVTNTFSINAQGLIGKIYAGTWDADWRLFSVNLPWGSKTYNTISFNNSRAGWDNVYVFLFDPANPDANLLGGNDYVAMTDSGNGIFKFDYPVTRDDLKIRFSEGDKATFTDDVDFIPGAMYYASGRVARRMPHAVPALADVNDSFTVTFTPEQPGQASAQIWIKTDGKPDNENIVITANSTTSASDLVDDSGLTVTVLPDAIHVTGNGIKELVLQSVAGAVVAGSDNSTVSTGHLPKGTYLLTIIRTDNGPVTRKISVK